MFIKMYNHPFLFYTLIGNHGQSRKSKKPKVNKLKIVLNLNVPIKKHTTSCLRLKKKKITINAVLSDLISRPP